MSPDAALQNLANLRLDFQAYGWGGFYDAINVETGEVARDYLALDQGMIMVAIANALLDDRLQGYFIQGEIQDTIKPLLERAQEDWSARCSPNESRAGAIPDDRGPSIGKTEPAAQLSTSDRRLL